MKWSDTGGGSFEQPPIGSHVARCIKVIDIGTHEGEFQGQATIKRQCLIAWELPLELMTNGDYQGKPFTVSKFYTVSLNEKATLRKDLANWRGRDFTEEELKGFDPQNIVGKPCMLSIIHNDKAKARVAGIMAMPKGMAIPDQVNPSVYFSLDEFDQGVFDSLSDGYKKMIQDSPEYRSVTSPHKVPQGSAMADFEDDIPFLFNVCTIRDTMGLPLSYWRGRHGKEMSLMRANETDF